MSGTATPDQIRKICQSADKYLYDEKAGGYRLNTDFGAVSDYCDYPESVKELPKAASSANPDIAAIKKLSPDLVITATPIVTKDRISLEAQGTKVLTIASPKTIET